MNINKLKKKWLKYGQIEAIIEQQMYSVDDDKETEVALMNALIVIGKKRQELQGEMKQMVHGKHATETAWYVKIVLMRENKMNGAFDDDAIAERRQIESAITGGSSNNELQSSDDDDEDPNLNEPNGEESVILSEEKAEELTIRTRRPPPPPYQLPYICEDDLKCPEVPTEIYGDQREGRESSIESESLSGIGSDESLFYDGQRYMTKEGRHQYQESSSESLSEIGSDESLFYDGER